jgi:DnaK suppressor protein
LLVYPYCLLKNTRETNDLLVSSQKRELLMERENLFLSEKNLTFIQTRLLKEKEKIEAKKNEFESFCLDKNELSDPLDEASVNVQTSQELRFRNREIFYLKKIRKSLHRIEKGIYGLCEECDTGIAFERLTARPTAELCIACKEEAELGEKNSIFGKKSKSLGKSISEVGIGK